MNNLDSINAARDQLNRTLTFFSRVDAKASVILGVDTGLLAVLATRAFPYATLRWEWIPIGLTLIALSTSFWHLFKEAFPVLKGGDGSALYFREVAKQTEAKYFETWKNLSDEQYLNELLGQVWRNSEILKQKFDHMRWAFYSLAVAIVPWVVSLALLTYRTPSQ